MMRIGRTIISGGIVNPSANSIRDVNGAAPIAINRLRRLFTCLPVSIFLRARDQSDAARTTIWAQSNAGMLSVLTTTS